MSEVHVRSVQETTVDAVREGTRSRRGDTLAVEEPIKITIRHGPEKKRSEASLGYTMRTPGHDEELVAGLLLAEGVVQLRNDLARITHAPDRDGHPDPNSLVAHLAPRVQYNANENERLLMRSSACGVCGRASLDVLLERGLPKTTSQLSVDDRVLRALPAALADAQAVFASTGGLHAAALFDPKGAMRVLREDVGRHNAVDKAVGAEFLAGRTPVSSLGLLVSGRASYEILQKALAAGCPFVAAIGAPSSLAVQLAEEFGITLVGFLKPGGYNVYAHAGRVGLPNPKA